ncbi:MAG: phytoene/squalene synthase family protein [Planctomycetota bacterium]
MSVHGPTLEESRAACEAIVRRRALNFFHGLRLTPEPERSSLFALYAWMREVDDIVDDGGAERERSLEAFVARTEIALAGNLPDDGHPMWPAFVEAVVRHGLPAEPFHDMVRGQRDDLDLETLPDWAALREFCRRVASTVGELCVRIWGLDDLVSIDLAERRGIAFQLTNILRDVREDHARGRVYLPQDELQAAEVSIEDLLGWRRPAACAAFVAAQCRRARVHYEESAPLEARLRPACRPTLWAMTRIYSGILGRIESRPARIAGTRVRLGTFRKVCIAFEAKRLGRRWARSAAASA